MPGLTAAGSLHEVAMESQELVVDNAAGIRRAQRIAGIVVIVVAICLAVSIMLSRSQSNARTPVSSQLKVTASNLTPDRRSGRLKWTGAVLNMGSQPTTAPWLIVTIYNPEGYSVDTVEVPTSQPTVAGHATVEYYTIFDARGTNMRSKARIETPNAHNLGM